MTYGEFYTQMIFHRVVLVEKMPMKIFWNNIELSVKFDKDNDLYRIVGVPDKKYNIYKGKYILRIDAEKIR